MKYSYSKHFNTYVNPAEDWGALSTEPMVSVIVATFNHENFIRAALDGILMQQTAFDYEIVLKEDCSTDTTRDIVIEYQKKYPDKIRLWLTKENLYGKKIRLDGYKYINAKYIARCEGDDYWTDPLKLQKQVDFLENNSDYSACFHEAILMKDGIELRKYANQNKQVFTTKDLFGRHFIPTASIVFRNGIDFPDWFRNVSSGDIATLLILSLNGNIYMLKDVMSVYRHHKGGVSNTHIGMTKVFGIAKLMTYFDDYTNGIYREDCKRALLYEYKSHILPPEKDLSQLSNFGTSAIIREIWSRMKAKLRI